MENLEELGLTSLRMVYDEIMYHGGEIKDFSIPTSPLIGCQSAHQKYKSDLDQNDLDLKRGESQKVEVTNKRKLLIEELNIVKKRKIDEESLIKQLKGDSEKLIIEAGETSHVAQMKSLVVKTSSFKKTAEDKEKILVDHASSIEKMEEEIKQ